MAIQLETERTVGSPVVTRTRIGEQFLGGLVRFDQRDSLKDGQPQLKDNGKPRQELVVTLLAYAGDMEAGIGGEYGTPARGDVVRLILKGGAFGQWIEAKNGLGKALEVGDMVWMNTTHAVRYESMGQHRELGQFTDQADVDAYRANDPAWQARRESLGFRGDLKIRPAKPDEAGFVADCEAKYLAMQRQGIQLDDEPGPFDGAAAAPPSAGSAGVSDLF